MFFPPVTNASITVTELLDIPCFSNVVYNCNSITCKGRRGVTGFYACHFSVSQHRDDGAYLLSVPVFTFFMPDF